VKCFSLRVSVDEGSKDGNKDECGTVSTWECSCAKPVLSTPTIALLTVQQDLHICEHINSADPAVVYFSPLLESIRLRNSEGTAATQMAVSVLHPWPSLVALVLYLYVPHTSSSVGVALSCRQEDLWILDPWPRFEPDNFRMADALHLLQNVNGFAANSAQNVFCPSRCYSLFRRNASLAWT
jgi:hypothetical protein